MTSGPPAAPGFGPEADAMPDVRHSGFVSLVGRPNVGKSTLVNALVGRKVAITSPRPQTTRNTIRGVLTIDEPPTQLVFVDTPGLHKPRNALGERLNRLVYGSLAEADVVAFVVDATAPIGLGDRRIATRLGEAGTPVVAVVNKCDVASPEQIGSQLAVAAGWDLDAYVPVSALTGDGLRPLVSELAVRLPEGPAYFPTGMHTDQPEPLLVAEIVREKFLARLREELPHSLAVVTDDMEMRDGGTLYVGVSAYVERRSQKGMVIGKGGGLQRAAGTEARRELESLFGVPIYLDVRVKVEQDWQRREQLFDRLGFSS